MADKGTSGSSETIRLIDENSTVSGENSTFQVNQIESNDQLGSSTSFKVSETSLDSSPQYVGEPSTSKEPEDSEWLDILGSGHLKKKVLVKGKEDSRPHRGETVILDVVGRLEDGSIFEKFDCLEVSIGDAEVVQGIDYALPLMDDGETAEIVVGPRFGYGSLGDPPRVPKDSTLYYTVTIKNIIDIIDVNSLPLEDRLRSGLKKKKRGNWWYQRKEYHLAIQCYRKALQYFEEDLKESNDQINEAKLNTYNNLSVAHFNLEAFDAALQSVNHVLTCEPNNIKAVYRKVKILKAQGDIEAAITLAKKGLKHKPDSPALQDELNVLIEIKKKSTAIQKDLYRKMFKNREDSDKKEVKPKTILSITWKWLGILTVAVGIIGAAAIKYKY